MNQREAKRLACRLVSRAIDALLVSDESWFYDDRTNVDLEGQDRLRVEAAWREIEDELWRRGRGDEVVMAYERSEKASE